MLCLQLVTHSSMNQELFFVIKVAAWAEVTSNSEKIESVPLVIVELCKSKDIKN